MLTIKEYTCLIMARQTRDQVNEARRLRYKERTRDRVNSRGIRDLGIITDRFMEGLSYRKIAGKWGVSVGCVQKIVKRCQ